jgi:glycosyltransferase involved in cell wall biosynthesis
VSIITICLNEASSIRATLESVAAQDCADFEYIVVDGGSTDGTLDILAEFEPRIDHLIAEPDNGIYNAMNKGIRASQGEYLLFLNGGDYLNDNHTLSQILAHNPDDDVVYGDMIWLRQNGDRELRTQPVHLTYSRFVTTNLWQQASIIRRSLFDQFGGFDEKYTICGDYEFFLRVLFRPGVTKRHLPVVFSVFNTSGLSQSRQKSIYLSHYRERKAIQYKHLPLPYLVIARARHGAIRAKRKLLRQY